MFSRIKRKKEEERRAMMKAHRAKVVKVAGASVVIGALGGILLAPKSGKETRKGIVDGVSKKGKAISDNSTAMMENASNSLQDKKEKISTSKKKIKDYFKKKKDEVDLSIEECFNDISKLSKEENYLEEAIPECVSAVGLNSESRRELVRDLKNVKEELEAELKRVSEKYQLNNKKEESSFCNEEEHCCCAEDGDNDCCCEEDSQSDCCCEEDDHDCCCSDEDSHNDCCSGEGEEEDCCCKSNNEETDKLSDALDHVKDELDKKDNQITD